MRRTCLPVLMLALPCAAAADSRPAAGIETPSPVAELHDPMQWLRARTHDIAGYVSSYDRTGDNDDGFKGTWSALHQLSGGEHVIVDLSGPGCLYTLWFTGPSGGYTLPWGRLRMYLDDEQTPRLDVPGRDLFDGVVPGFPRPLVADSFTSTGGNVSYVPVAFAKRLVITTEQRAGFYNAYYRLYPPGTQVSSWTPAQDVSAARSAWRSVGAPPDEPDLTWHRAQVAIPSSEQGGPTELLRLSAGGTIRALRLDPVRPLDAVALHALRLKIWFDEQMTPSVDAPLGPFFGSAQGEACVRGMLIGMSPSGQYYCHLPMPFSRSAKIAVTNSAPGRPVGLHLEVGVGPVPTASPVTHLHARYREERPTREGRDFVLLDLEDQQGTLAGYCLFVEPTGPDNKQWWEGDLRVWTDGRRDPILNGTGHEDELLGGWSSRWLMNPYSLPLHGLPSVTILDDRPGKQVNAAMSAYRFFPGGIPFRSGIRVSTEHGVNNRVLAGYAGVAFWYARPAPAMHRVDVLEVADQSSREAHGWSAPGAEPTGERLAAFNGDSAAPTLKAGGLRGQTHEGFRLKVPGKGAGLLLRRLYHQSLGMHRATLKVNGRRVREIGTPDDSRVDRWREEDVILPAAVLAEGETAQLEIAVEQGTWNAFRYEAFALPSSAE